MRASCRQGQDLGKVTAACHARGCSWTPAPSSRGPAKSILVRRASHGARQRASGATGGRTESRQRGS